MRNYHATAMAAFVLRKGRGLTRLHEVEMMSSADLLRFPARGEELVEAREHRVRVLARKSIRMVQRLRR